MAFLNDPCAAFNTAAPQRVVSLVPSVTGSLYDLRLDKVLVGVTDYCMIPAGATITPVRIGGPKTLRVDAIVALQPDLVVANQEENDRDQINRLSDLGIAVWLTFPVSVREALQDLWVVANLFRSEQAMHQVDQLEKGVEWAEKAGQNQPLTRYFCPIWEDVLESGERWWMVFNSWTYPNDALRIFGGENIFASRQRRYPLLADLGREAPEVAGERDTRYPRVSYEEILAGAPEVILLPDEPFAYSDTEQREFLKLFADTPAGKSSRIFQIDGSLITWHGTRLAEALTTLPEIFLP